MTRQTMGKHTDRSEGGGGDRMGEERSGTDVEVERCSMQCRMQFDYINTMRNTT